VEATLRGADQLSVRDVREARFRESPVPRGGYYKREVDAFLGIIATALESGGQPQPEDGSDSATLGEVEFDDSASGEQGYDKIEVDAFMDRVYAAMRGTHPLTARDVYEVKFRVAPVGERGYDRRGVDAFLTLVAVTLRQTTLKRPATPRRNGEAATSAVPPAATELVTPGEPGASNESTVPVAPDPPAAPSPPVRQLTADDVRVVAFRPPNPGERGYDVAEVDAFLDRTEATLRGEDNLTAADVAQVRFGEAVGDDPGYDMDDVDDFLDLVERRLTGA